jgi:hypothetical protein
VRAPVFLLALALGAAAAMLVACGDRSGLIPSGDASQLDQHLDAVHSAVANGDCAVVDVRVQRVRGDVDNLRANGIDRRLYRRLSAGVSTLSERAQTECQAPETTTTQTQTQQTTTTPTQTETTQTQQTTTVPTTTTPTTTTPTVPTPTTTTNSGGFGTGTDQSGNAGATGG